VFRGNSNLGSNPSLSASKISSFRKSLPPENYHKSSKREPFERADFLSVYQSRVTLFPLPTSVTASGGSCLLESRAYACVDVLATLGQALLLCNLSRCKASEREPHKGQQIYPVPYSLMVVLMLECQRILESVR